MARFHFAAPLAAFALLSTAVPAAAARNDQPDAAATQAQASDSDAKAERKICKNLPNTVRRVKSERLCLTRAQWKEYDEAVQQ